MTTKPAPTGGSFFSGHDCGNETRSARSQSLTNSGAGFFSNSSTLLDSPMVPIAPQQVRQAALHVVSRSASQEEAGTFLQMLAIGRLEVEQGMFYGDTGGLA